MNTKNTVLREKTKRKKSSDKTPPIQPKQKSQFIDRPMFGAILSEPAVKMGESAAHPEEYYQSTAVSDYKPWPIDFMPPMMQGLAIDVVSTDMNDLASRQAAEWNPDVPYRIPNAHQFSTPSKRTVTKNLDPNYDPDEHNAVREVAVKGYRPANAHMPLTDTGLMIDIIGEDQSQLVQRPFASVDVKE